MLIPTDPKVAFVALLSRTQQRPRTAEQLAAAQLYGVSPVDGSTLPSDAAALSAVSSTVSTDGSASRRLVSGSSRPHAPDAEAADAQRVARLAKPGSLRQLEPERSHVLQGMPMPRCNIPRPSDLEEPPHRIGNPPGPFSTAELIPDGVVPNVSAHGRRVRDILRRAQRGDKGAQVARALRPQPLIYTEAQALNPCGWGYVWHKRADEDLWDVVQPSTADDPPDTSFEGKVFAADAEAFGMVDKQLVSWGLHGFPGARERPSGIAVIGHPHAGALKHAATLEELNQRDIANGFVSHGEEFPSIWPCTVDCMNVVMQHGKGRATIDKTIRLSSTTHPEPVASYNDYIDLVEEREHHPFQLVRVATLTTAFAILATAGVVVKLGKFDLSTYFRIFGKQRAFVHQSGRLYESLFGFDRRVNFGERDAPDHTGRASDALAFFVRHELKRLGREYAPKCAKIVAWVAMRMGHAAAAGDTDDADGIWFALFFFLYYVDDAGLAAFDDALCRSSGEPVIIQVVDRAGVVTKRQQHRAELYFEAAMQIVRRYGHDTPLKKQSPMALTLEFLGVWLDSSVLRRLLTRDKRRAYLKDLRAVAEARTVPNGTREVAFDTLNSLVHKLLHACEVVPIGRAHLFHLRVALKAAKHNHGRLAYLGAKAVKELAWWASQLDNAEACESHGVPFASRLDFPTSGDHTIVQYSDASRETDEPAASGFGAWAVIAGVFVFVEGRWTAQEVERYSINVLEAWARDIPARCFLTYARSVGLRPTHSLAYVDNSTAECIAESGRATTEGLHQLNAARQQWLVDEGIHQSNERVASVDNDVADLLSRGDVEEALRFPAASGLPVLRLAVEVEQRDFSHVAPTWA